MKQTAVEWLENRLIESGIDFLSEEIEFINQAKEMEKQQEYSDEDLKKAFKTGFSIGYGSDVLELDFKDEYCQRWFEQFKNK